MSRPPLPGPPVTRSTGGREFFTARTVDDALAGFRPARRTTVQDVALADALHRVPASDVRAAGALPGFAKSTVDGYAVRAADTYGASEGLPSYLDLAGAVRMGIAPGVVVAPGTAVAMPTGGVLPAGADAVVMVEHTAETMPGTIEVTRPAAPGTGLVRADEDVAAGGVLVVGGRPLRAPDLGLLAAAGITTVAVHARPRVAIVSTGDEIVPPSTVDLRPGQVRDATASALAGLVLDAGGEPVPPASSPTTPAPWSRRCAPRCRVSTSWSSRPGRRSALATRPPLRWAHSAGSGATGSPSSPASRRCWRSAQYRTGRPCR